MDLNRLAALRSAVHHRFARPADFGPSAPTLAMAMQLVRTKALMRHGVDETDPLAALALVLESALELVSLPDIDFSWSSWEDSNHAAAEVQSLLEQVRSGTLPSRLTVSVLFAPTGPIQEVSLSSGWADSFLKMAEKYDEVEALLWKDHG